MYCVVFFLRRETWKIISFLIGRFQDNCWNAPFFHVVMVSYVQHCIGSQFYSFLPKIKFLFFSYKHCWSHDVWYCTFKRKKLAFLLLLRPYITSLIAHIVYMVLCDTPTLLFFLTLFWLHYQWIHRLMCGRKYWSDWILKFSIPWISVISKPLCSCLFLSQYIAFVISLLLLDFSMVPDRKFSFSVFDGKNRIPLK